MSENTEEVLRSFRSWWHGQLLRKLTQIVDKIFRRRSFHPFIYKKAINHPSSKSDQWVAGTASKRGSNDKPYDT